MLKYPWRLERQVDIMAHRKIVFVIVEGASDAEAIGIMLEQLYSDKDVYLHITKGDITTKKGISADNIKNAIGNMISGYAKSNHFNKSFFQEIIHIVDMDGAYIPDTAVQLEKTAEKPLYEIDKIFTKNLDGIYNRNEAKRGCLNKLSITPKIWNVPYQVYYMSCNLDHVLYDEQNLSDDEKEDKSLDFALKYKGKVEEFVDYISNSPFSITGSYLESWDFIKKELHSLERYTNFGICLQRAKESVQEKK